MFFFSSGLCVLWMPEQRRCVSSAQSVQVGAISYLVTLYESNGCQKQDRGGRYVHCMTLMPSYPPCCRTPTDGKSASAQHASVGHINMSQHTPSHIQPQTHTHTGNIHKEKLEAHTHPWQASGQRGERGYCYGWERTRRSWFVSESVWCCYGRHLAVRESVATQMPGGPAAVDSSTTIDSQQLQPFKRPKATWI